MIALLEVVKCWRKDQLGKVVGHCGCALGIVA